MGLFIHVKEITVLFIYQTESGVRNERDSASRLEDKDDKKYFRGIALFTIVGISVS